VSPYRLALGDHPGSQPLCKRHLQLEQLGGERAAGNLDDHVVAVAEAEVGQVNAEQPPGVGDDLAQQHVVGAQGRQLAGDLVESRQLGGTLASLV